MGSKRTPPSPDSGTGEALLTSLIEENPLAIVVLDPQGRVTMCNPAFEALFLYPGSEILGRELDPLITSEEHLAEARELTSGAFGGEAVHVATRRVRKDGAAVHVELHCVPLIAGGEIAGSFGLYQDITERVRSERSQREREGEVRQSQKMEAVGRLAGGIAHDFNNLLTIILGHCSMLMRRVPADSELQGSLGEIHRAADQAALMTRRLLAFGRKQSVKTQILDLNQVLKGMERMLRRLVRADIDLRVDTDAGLGKVHADPGQIEQVILNLVINAGDAMPGGGTLTLETSACDLDDTAACRGLEHVPPPWVLLTVKDTGIGMDAATLERLFEPFFTTKKKGEGTGLGLATVYGIVKQNGGNIVVDSRPGHGTTFRIFFPQIGEGSADAAATHSEPRTVQGSETVLVVEDEPGVRRLAMDFLELHGYRVMEAENGLEALEAVRRSGHAIQLILTDVVMPRMNGPDMAEHIALTHPEIKVLFMSGYEDGVLHRHESMAAARIVQKPFSMQALAGAVREALDRPPAASAADRRPAR